MPPVEVGVGTGSIQVRVRVKVSIHDVSIKDVYNWVEVPSGQGSARVGSLALPPGSFSCHSLDASE